jgi:RNA polymerase sigma-70 factor, ECF subfamily
MKKGREEIMFVSELQPSVNAIRDLSVTAGNQGTCDEHSLVAKAKSGNDDAFAELYKRHQRKAYCTALRILRNQQDAEDAAQRAFQRALVNIQRFRGGSTFSTWLTRIVINEALLMLRQIRRRDPFHESSVDAAQGESGMQIPDGGPTPEEILCESERHAALHQAIGQLRKNQRIVVLHRELQGLSSAETAQRLGLTVSAVKARTFHARRFLKKHLERSFKRAGALRKQHKRRALQVTTLTGGNGRPDKEKTCKSESYEGMANTIV